MKTKLMTISAVAVVMMVLCAPALAEYSYSGADRDIVYEQDSGNDPVSISGDAGVWDDLDLSMSVYVEPPINVIVYSGANQDITYEQYSYPDPISIAGEGGTWDDLQLSLHVMMEDISAQTMLEVHGNHVQTAASGGWLVKLDEGDTIDSSLSYSIGYNNFFNYLMEMQNGEFFNQSGYIGLKLIDGTDTYYGWARVTTQNCNNSSATLTVHDWAYNTRPDEPINAGAKSYYIEGTSDIYATTLLEDHGNHVQTAASGGWLVKLDEGDTIDSSLSYSIGYNNFFSYYKDEGMETQDGGFYNQSGYIGLKLIDGTDTYYGWARVTTQNCNNSSATLTVHDWAYNTIPDEPINAEAKCSHYLDGDVNLDCLVDFKDFALMAGQWLQRTNILQSQ